jgi:hypothetical protein
VPFLDQAQLGEAIDIVMHLGHAALGDPSISLKSYRGDRQHDLMKAGFAIVEDWPRKFVDLLDGRRERGSGWGNDQQFGQLYRWIKTLGPGGGNNELKHILLQYVADTTVTTKTAKARNFQKGQQGTVASLTKELGISAAKCRLYLAAVGNPVSRSGSGRANLVDDDVRQQVLELFEGRINQTQLQERLGVGKKVTRELIGLGFFAEDQVHRQVSRSMRIYRTDDVDHLLSRLSQGLVETTADEVAGELVPLPQAAQRCRDINTARACQMILEGRLRCRGWRRDAVGLAGLLITVADIKAAARKA